MLRLTMMRGVSIGKWWFRVHTPIQRICNYISIVMEIYCKKSVEFLNFHNIIGIREYLHIMDFGGGIIVLERPEIQEEFKQVLESAIQRGNEEIGITLEEFMNELRSQLRLIFDKNNA